MVRWIFAAIGVVVLSLVIAATHMHFREKSYRRPYDAAAAELRRKIDLDYEEVSLVSLLAVPERYARRKVQVRGFVTLEHEGTGLYMDEVAYQAGLRKSAVWLDRPRWLTAKATRRVDRRYVRVAGTFVASEHGAYGSYSGALTNLRRIEPSSTRSDFVRWRLQQRDEVMAATLFSGQFLILLGWSALLILWILTRRGSKQ